MALMLSVQLDEVVSSDSTRQQGPGATRFGRNISVPNPYFIDEEIPGRLSFLFKSHR